MDRISSREASEGGTEREGEGRKFRRVSRAAHAAHPRTDASNCAELPFLGIMGRENRNTSAHWIDPGYLQCSYHEAGAFAFQGPKRRDRVICGTKIGRLMDRPVHASTDSVARMFARRKCVTVVVLPDAIMVIGS